MLDMTICEESITYTFMARNKKFILEIDAEMLEGKGYILDEFHGFLEDLDDPDNFADFETWAVDAVHEHVLRLCPEPLSRPTSLLDFYNAATHVFQLYNDRGTLRAMEIPLEPGQYGQTDPKFPVVEKVEDVNSEICSSYGSTEQYFLLKSALPNVPIFPASHLIRAAGLDSIEEKTCAVPRMVKYIHTNEEYYFKSSDDRHGFRREVEILTKLQGIREHDRSIRTSRIAGLVHWDGDRSLLMGMLIEKIEGGTLSMVMKDSSLPQEQIWMDQIESAVRRLHSHGIAWGDVKPDNVMIESDGNAVIIDFGGGCTHQYVSGDLQETEEGDLQGLKAMKSRLLGS